MSLDDGQFEVGGYLVGPGTDVKVMEWDPAEDEIRDQDQASGFGDWRIFGTDRETPASWGFTFAIEQPTSGDVLAVRESLRAAWRPAARITPQATVALRYAVGGRTRQVFGRPRRFSSVTGNLSVGFLPVVADFALAHTGSFDDSEQSVSLSLGATVATTGVTFPASFPVLWGAAAASPRHVSVTVGGTRDTYVTARITAGVETLTDPYVIVAGRTVQLQGSVAPGEAVHVIGTPWDARVVRADGSASSLTLSSGSRLADLTVSPGLVEVSFGGIDGSGTATCAVAWRDAYHSI